MHAALNAIGLFANLVAAGLLYAKGMPAPDYFPDQLAGYRDLTEEEFAAGAKRMNHDRSIARCGLVFLGLGFLLQLVGVFV